MAIFIELTTDAFDTQALATAQGARVSGITKAEGTRRPLRGLEIKDETHAYLKVVQANGEPIKLLDAGSRSGDTDEYSNFILQQVTETRMERHQIVETFGDTYLYLFGEAPRFLQVNAVLLNSNDFNWKAEFMENYDRYLRGTKAIERGARTYLFYDSNIVEGYILNAQVNELSTAPMEVPLSFQFFVTNHQNISVIGDTNPNFPVRASAIIPGFGLDPTDPDNTYAYAFFQGNTDATQISSENLENRSLPLRSMIWDNMDEYLAGGGRDDPTDILDYYNDGLEVTNLNTALGDTMSAYGVDDPFAYGPNAADNLGYGPSFGVPAIARATASVSAFATFGAVASVGVSALASIGVGGFAGVRLSAIARAFSGVGASAGAGAFAGPQMNAYGQPVNQFGQPTNPLGSSLGAGSLPAPRGLGAFFGASVGARAGVGGVASNTFGAPGFNPNTPVNARSGSPYSPTRRNGGTATAFASAKPSVVTAVGYSFSSASARTSAQAGGYTGANSYLGNPPNTPSASYPFGNVGSGAAVSVTGQPSAFSFVSAPGTLTNSDLPPNVALAQQPRPWAWSKSKQWPSE